MLKEGKPGISACGPGWTRCASSSTEQGRWEKVAAGRTEDLTVGPRCQTQGKKERRGRPRAGCPVGLAGRTACPLGSWGADAWAGVLLTRGPILSVGGANG